MNLHALRIFTQVAKTGSVTRSAENLLISQPAVTAQIRNLENELGLKLLESKGRSIQLTEAGNILAVSSQRLFSLEQEIEKEMYSIRTGVKGRLVMCATEFPGRTLLPGWIVQYKKLFPMVDVKLFRSSSASAFQQLLDYSVHIAIICGELENQDEIECHKIMVDELIFIIHSDHPFAGKEVDFQQLMKESFILREKGSYTLEKFLSLCNAIGVNRPSSSITIEGVYETIEAVKSGYGIALVPGRTVEKDLKNGEIARISVPNLIIKHPVWLCTRKHEKPLSPAANFISLIIE